MHPPNVVKGRIGVPPEMSYVAGVCIRPSKTNRPDCLPETPTSCVPGTLPQAPTRGSRAIYNTAGSLSIQLSLYGSSSLIGHRAAARSNRFEFSKPMALPVSSVTIIFCRNSQDIRNQIEPCAFHQSLTAWSPLGCSMHKEYLIFHATPILRGESIFVLL